MTPLISAQSFMPELYMKIEYNNPSLSIKHRSIPNQIFSLFRDNVITQKTRLAILTAGSAGASVAWAARQIGCESTVVVPNGTSENLLRYIKWLGAEVIATEPSQVMDVIKEYYDDQACKVVEQLSDPSFISHYREIGDELQKQHSEISAVTVPAGTAASVMGISHSLRKLGIKIYAVEPAEAPVLQGGPWGPHNIPGLAPPVKTKLFDPKEVDGIISIPSQKAWDIAASVLGAIGEPVGPSSGAAIAAAQQLREEGLSGDIIAICPSQMVTSL
ncbi:MAG TPA: pyridoxal-phosphate dependent enzyme [Gammaproteobacteria bacterium]|nr:pyridoxal-phosphate dependent enzyme [Gammaproteobacteria bacterium]